jgi:uncharacterized protein (DUF58 family)
LSKQFSGSAATEIWLDLDDTPSSMALEDKMSRLARWVLESESAGLRYGMRLPGTEFIPDTGTSHRHRCLQALALFKQ